MLLERVTMSADELHAATGWEIKPQGACKGPECVPLGDLDTSTSNPIDVRAFAAAMGMPFAADEKHQLWALGPRAGGHVLHSTELPEIVLDDFAGKPFDVASLRGRKVLLISWASW
jgi:hypothetical protein